MKSLEPPDTLRLRAAQAWLELGNYVEADAGLDGITASLRAHPDVLKVRWEVYAAAKKWEAALDIAAALVRLAPEQALGWVHRSYAPHELKRTAEARDNLLAVVEKFPEDAAIGCNLARYECQLGRLEQARRWLQKSFEIGDPRKLKLMALDGSRRLSHSGSKSGSPTSRKIAVARLQRGVGHRQTKQL
ncbi:MAG TPA: hypothetical protein VN829_00560 [Dongiaceae bacterium]|nr:hypothetical protein [Dongiaceae bacterium]